VVIYSERKFIDYPFSAFIQVIPFKTNTPPSPEDTTQLYPLIARQISPTKIKITCTDKLTNSSGNQITAFNVVQAWTNYIKNNPAEGIALFYHVKGIKKFIKGEEAIIQGFSVINQKNIMLLLSKTDSHALQRLYSPRLLPASLNLGQLYIKNIKKNSITLNQNVHYHGNKSFINQCTIICGNDKKPIISYSLNKYDMITLYTKKDIEYANRSLIKNSNVLPFSTDRYFVSLAPKSTELRSCLKKIIIPLEIQKNAVKAEGELLSTIESSDQKQTPEKRDPNIKKPSDIGPIRILYNSDDPISTSIAEKIFSDLSNSGISSKLMGLTVHKVQNSLIDRSYEIAIGWVSDRIVTDESEKLRLAAIWFNGENNEAKRITKNLEIPLFAIKKYALCKKHIKFYKNRLTGLFRQD
jgi:hypothetical protein